MTMFMVAKHVLVFIESPESMARREENPRRRKRFELMCSCGARRRPDGHCVHTLALFQDSINPKYWRYVTPVGMKAKDGPVGEPIRPRIELERELVVLRSRVAELEYAAARMEASDS